jgi:hypothetical protein
VTGSINGRVGTEKNCIVSDILNKLLLDAIELLEYETDELFPNRLTENLRSPNSFGSRILELCKSSGLIICDGRFGQDSSKITFSNFRIITTFFIRLHTIFTFFFKF